MDIHQSAVCPKARLFRVVASAAIVALSVTTPSVARQSAPADEDSKVVITVGDRQVTGGDLTDFALWSGGLEEKGQPGAFMLRVLDLRTFEPVAPGGPLPNQVVAGLLLAQEAARHHLQTAAGFPSQTAPLQQADWLANAEFDRIVLEAQSSEELSKYFAAHQEDFESIEFRSIGIRKAFDKEAGLSPKDAKERADAIRKSIEAGTPFEQIREKYEIPRMVLLKTQTIARASGRRNSIASCSV